ncbi:B-cell CLL/lymphoma 6 member B protein-like [Arapaima gigas]
MVLGGTCSCGTRGTAMTSSTTSHLMELNSAGVMSSRVAFHDKLVSVMEVLANAAVAEICQLVDEGYALLRLEVSQRQKENEELRMKLQTMELLVARERVELRAVGGGRHVEQAPVGQVEDSQVDGSGSDPDSPVKVALLDTVCLPAVCCVDGPEAKEPGADRLLIKEETLEEPLGNSNDEEDGDNDDDDAKVNTGNQQGGEGIMDAVKRHPVGDTCVTAWLSEHLEMGHGIREGAAPEAALKMEPGREVMEETPAITESEDKLDRMSVNFVCSARECSAQLGQHGTEIQDLGPFRRSTDIMVKMGKGQAFPPKVEPI